MSKISSPLPRFAKFPEIKSWDNVKPVSPEAEKAIIEQFVGDQQIATTKARHLYGRLRRRDIAELTPRGLLALTLYAKGISVTKLSESLDCYKVDVVRVLKWAGCIHGLTCPILRSLGQQGENIPEVILRYVKNRQLQTTPA